MATKFSHKFLPQNDSTSLVIMQHVIRRLCKGTPCKQRDVIHLTRYNKTSKCCVDRRLEVGLTLGLIDRCIPVCITTIVALGRQWHGRQKLHLILPTKRDIFSNVHTHTHTHTHTHQRERERERERR